MSTDHHPGAGEYGSLESLTAPGGSRESGGSSGQCQLHHGIAEIGPRERLTVDHRATDS